MTTLIPASRAFCSTRLDHRRVVGHDSDHVDALGDEILDGAHLQCGIGASGADHERIIAHLRAFFLDALLHGVEPGNAADLDDDADLGVLGARPAHGYKRKRRSNRGDTHSLFQH